MTKLQKIKAEKHISYKDLAKRLKLRHWQSVQVIAARGIKSPATAIRYAAALGCKVEDLLEWDLRRKATKLRRMRAVSGITVEELGRRVGVEASSIYAIERYGLHGVRTAGRYAAALGCKVEDLLEIK